MALLSYRLKAKVWLHQGAAGWHFLTLPKKQAREIRMVLGGATGRGWGSVPVVATVGGTTWRTSIFPDKKAGSFVLPLKAEVRAAEGIGAGDTVEFLLEVRRHPHPWAARRKGVIPDRPLGEGMHRIEKSIEVDVPVTTCYNQWTQFESFPSFMEGVVEVQQLDDKRLRWVAEVAGDRKEWTAEIVEQRPDEVISWRSTSGAMNNGSVTFQEVAPNRCKVTLIMTYETVGLKEKVGDALGVLNARIEGDLRRFKEFIETQQVPTGAWRGEIREGQVRNTAKGPESFDVADTLGRDKAVEAEAARFRAEKKK